MDPRSVAGWPRQYDLSRVTEIRHRDVPVARLVKFDDSTYQMFTRVWDEYYDESEGASMQGWDWKEVQAQYESVPKFVLMNFEFNSDVSIVRFIDLSLGTYSTFIEMAVELQVYPHGVDIEEATKALDHAVARIR